MESPRWKPNKTKGYKIAHPDHPPTEARGANGRLINRDVDKSNEYREILMYVTHIQTGWQLAGQKTQARTSASFYPTNLQQNDVVIRGICPNQYEYDRLVDFVRHHQRTAQRRGGDRLNRVDFKLFSTREVNGRVYFPPMSVGGHISSIKAGHERFKFQPTFEMALKVSFDNLDPQVQTRYQVDDLLRQYQAGLQGGGWYDGPSDIKVTTMDEAREEPPTPREGIDTAIEWVDSLFDIDRYPPSAHYNDPTLTQNDLPLGQRQLP